MKQGMSKTRKGLGKGLADLLVGDSSCLALSDASGAVVWRCATR